MRYIFSVLLGAIVSYFAATQVYSIFPGTPSEDAAYDRVMATKTIRCGYALWPMYVEKDPNTGALTGFYHDVIEILAKRMGFTVDWTLELPIGDMFEALNSQRIDAMCAGIWPDELRASRGEFTTSIAYQGVYAFARSNDLRFQSEDYILNDPNLTIATIDGEMSQHIKSRSAPLAQEYSIPKDGDSAQALLAVAAGKADVTFTDIGSGSLFIKSHPGTVQTVGKTPLSAHGVTTVLRKGENKLATSISIATTALQLSGEIDAILNRYDPEHRIFERVKSPF